jgi:hypothetical protein
MGGAGVPGCADWIAEVRRDRCEGVGMRRFGVTDSGYAVFVILDHHYEAGFRP